MTVTKSPKRRVLPDKVIKHKPVPTTLQIRRFLYKSKEAHRLLPHPPPRQKSLLMFLSMKPLLLTTLYLLYFPVALLCLLAVLIRREESHLQSREKMSQEWLSYQAQQYLQEDRQDRL